MRLEDVHSAYFIGIGGIGMSALARWFHERGAKVAGYDRVSSVITDSLSAEGIAIHFQDNLESISQDFRSNEDTLVIFTPAVPKDHKELNFFIEGGFEVKKRSEVLGMISRGHYTIAVGGTHGKTTTSSMVAHLLNTEDGACSAFVGGIMTNYDSNLIIGKSDAAVVVEADEFDRSFLRLTPNYSILTSLDPDHLDIYGDESTMQKTYLEFLSLNDKKAELLLHIDTVRQLGDQLDDFSYQSFGLEGADIHAANLTVEDGYNVFDYVGTTTIRGLKLRLPGYHNVSNAIAAITVALSQGLSPETIKSQMESYAGVKRRFEYHLKTDRIVYIDDYAHHPSEIKALISSVRFLYPGKRIAAVFQPHLFSRTRDFQKGFSEELSAADEVLLLPIYPAREKPIPGVTSSIIFNEITTSKRMVEKEEFPEIIADVNPEVLLTVGAGDIDRLVPEIANYLKKGEGVEA